ncbi:carbohydrate ABC transporter permease [Parasphaerochaeta coccoides]|uniref:Carbohydrate ABC transporter membrane protein 1, CUT1 family n=1 Tax=Parasphaerochaeta coccoides (strain ATCC BAA-1237 / DSM 17374 / SPN1) TaxID=760011 RepID=F4GIX5_PARC1|nr:sugar ABC transporter permease [Parasphaerochaeta coccoides]AEC02743.1 carbohydrate ABC transporter membrane protein 1, CUT1 family [Parasphaerochaeta coccoides DSM 17374]
MVTHKKRERFWFFLFVFPALISFFIVVIIPFLIGIGYSFVSWDGLSMNPVKFVGMDNYARLFTDVRFGESAQHTVIFTFLSVILINVLGLVLALLVTSRLKVTTIARTMFFMPNLIGGLILGYIWKFILSDAFKAIGTQSGLTGVFFNWLLHPTAALMALVVVITWQMAGYVMIIYITGIQSVPEEVMEAATIDGAGPWRKFFTIELPLIMPSVTICTFYSLSNCFKIYDINLSLTGGGPGTSTEMFAMNIFNEIFSYNNYGYGQAKAILFFLLIAVVAITQVSLTKRREVQL